MTDFMTALHLILVQPTCPADQRVKGVQFHLTCNLCRDSHKSHVWLCFLLLGFLCRSICATPEEISELSNLQTCLKPLIQNKISSDAMLYAPDKRGERDERNEHKDNCDWASLRCFMLELKMVLNEEGIQGISANCIFHFLEAKKEKMQAHADRCPVCETHSLENTTIFLERLKTLLEEMNSNNSKKNVK